jgi:SIR2-like domain
MFNLEAALGRDHFEALMRGMARGRYQALLGAGASATSLDRNGASLPVGNALRDELLELFEIAPDGDASLKRVYQVAKRKSSPSGVTLADYIERRFTHTTPAPWYDEMLKLRWAGLWTLNIDDCLERSANRLGSSALQNLRSISWTDRHSQSSSHDDELLLVHLHGKAARASRENELIFDISSYVNALTSQHRWLKVFGDEFPVAPFLIIGATLQEEIELQSIFEEGRATLSAEHPSIIILRSMSAFQREEYEGYGLLPVACTAEELVAAIHDALPRFLKELAPQEVLEAVGTEPAAFRFLAQWTPLTSELTLQPDKHHDLFLGHEPSWPDAVRGLISRRSVIERLISNVTRDLPRGKHAIQVLTGETFSGKSAILLKACKELEGLGYMPYIFKEEIAVDIDAAIYWLQRVPRAVLVIDDASDFARDIDLLLADPRLAGVSARIILTARLSRGQHIEDELALHQFDRLAVLSSLSPNEVSALIDLLASRKRLGSLTQMKPNERKAYFDDRGRKLFSAMAALEDGRGFKARVVEEFDRVGSAETRRLLAVTGLANKLGYYLPIEIIKTAAGLTANQAEKRVFSQLQDLLLVENSRVTARHKVFGELLVDYLGLSEKIEAIVDLALAAAPHVSPAAISASTIYYRIVRTMMGHEMLLRLLNSNYDAALEVYDRIEAAYSWNARFWDQRALAASANRRFEEAFSWAQQALQKRKDSFSLNTIGVVLMRRAVYEAKSGQWPTDTYEKGQEYLLEARQLEQEKADYPIETFFSYTIRLLQDVEVRDRGLNLQIATLWTNWYAAMLMVDEQTKARLERTRADAASAWERFNLGGS